MRQTFGFGGEQEELASGQLQLAGKVDVNRLTLQAGKFSVVDVFDGNAYAKDTAQGFHELVDVGARRVRLCRRQARPRPTASTAELNQKQWALRGGYFLMGAVSNSNNFDTQVLQRGSTSLELETRYSLFSQPGKLRTIGWLNSAYSGSYRETLNNPALNLDIAQTRTGRTKYGYVVNVEQAITDDHRPVRPLELERRQDRDHGLHRYRRLALDGHLDQGHQMGPARRRDRHRRRHQRAVARSSRLHRRRRARRP